MKHPDLDLQALFFDLDGTCVNSDHIHFSTYRDTLMELAPTFNSGLPITRTYYDTHMSGRQNPELVASLLPSVPLPIRTHLWQTKEARYEDRISRGVPPISGLPDLLAFARAKHLRTYVVTNAPRGSCHKTMAAIGIAEHFGSHVVVAEDCAAPKPDPAPYLTALKLAGVRPDQAVVFEDSPSGTCSAVAAGLLTIGVRSTQTDETLRAAGATLTIGDYRDAVLQKALAKWVA